MKILRLLKTAIAVGLMLSTVSCRGESDVLTCNIGVADITPVEPVVLAGFAARVGLSTTVHRPLSTNALVIKRGATKVCIITNDLMEMAPYYADDIRNEIAEKSGIAAENVYFHCIHTHSAPRTGSYGAVIGAANDRYREQIFRAIIDNAVKTITDDKKFVPFTMEFGTGTCDMNINRCVKTDFCDHSVNVLRLVGKDRKVIASLVNYGCHPVSLNARSLLVSSDYPGVMREQIEPLWGGRILFFTGAAGNIDPAGGLSSDTAYVLAKGTKLADAMKNITFKPIRSNGKLKVVNRTIDLPYAIDNVTPEAVNAWADSAKMWNVSGTWSDDTERWRADILDKFSRGEVKSSLPFNIATVNVGGVVLLFTQGEPFSEYQFALRNEFPDTPLLFIAYTNGQNSYLPSPAAYESDNSAYDYETKQMHVYIKAPFPLSTEMPEYYSSALQTIVKDVLQ